MKNHKYRVGVETINALHDMQVMMKNAQDFFELSAGLSHKMKRLSEWFTGKLSKM